MMDDLDDPDISLGLGSMHVDDQSQSQRQSINGENLELRNQTKTTSVLRCLVITSLLTVAAIVSNVAFIIALNEEESAFEKEYGRLSDRLVRSFLESMSEKIWTADMMATEFAAYVNQEASLEWPHVSLPDFELQLEGARRLAAATTISFAPLFQESERTSWETYAVSAFVGSRSSKNSSSTYEYNHPHDEFHPRMAEPLAVYHNSGERTVEDGIYRVDEGVLKSEGHSAPSIMIAPIWQVAPFDGTTKSTVMFNQMSEFSRNEAITAMVESGGYVVSELFYEGTADSVHESFVAPLLALFYPIYDGSEERNIKGVLTFELGLESFIEAELEGTNNDPLIVVLQNTCGQEFTFEVRGGMVSFLGEGDLHKNEVDLTLLETGITKSTYEAFNETLTKNADIFPAAQILCGYKIDVHPTEAFKLEYMTNIPLFIQLGIGLLFLFISGVFISYDCMVDRRQRRVLDAAQISNAIVCSLYPAPVRARLFKEAESTQKKQNNVFNKKGHKNMSKKTTPKLRLKKFLVTEPLGNTQSSVHGIGSGTEPIADLFPSATILFADIAGFTAWSSEREPSQVFTLLETLYGVMDQVARRLGVFKVETIGDCYVAATGLPDPGPNHAVAMLRFANAFMTRIDDLTKALESTLGPGTADLSMRVGIHSGPVTAGVLRGEKSRFQLFGDTMNTASRIESTGQKGQVQISKDTADLIIAAGKSHWITPRKELVSAKGKGEMQTYWLLLQGSVKAAGGPDERGLSTTSSAPLRPQLTRQRSTLRIFDEAIAQQLQESDRIDRLVDWNVQLMMSMLRRIVAQRGETKPSLKRQDEPLHMPTSWAMLEEVCEVVVLPTFDPVKVSKSPDASEVILPQTIESELRDYISQIAASYLKNPFHNFEHASHVCLSAIKLLKRITRPDEVNYRDQDTRVAQDLHIHTYGISSDPLTQFAVVFSALIHDAGHTGVPNNQLAKENPVIAARYKNKSIAEQRSVDIAWELFSAPCYSNLRACLFGSQEEEVRFRQLIVNGVMATDIFDKELSGLRKDRWTKAFGSDPKEAGTDVADADADALASNRKAAIVIEHIIQASDVAHTMQHWHVYQKWNKRLFTEMYSAFQAGRSDNDPSQGWYKGELSFFDNYVIPLARKLRECEVFGVSSDEYLNYALENREEWERKGQIIVVEMLASMPIGKPLKGNDEAPSAIMVPSSGQFSVDL